MATPTNTPVVKQIQDSAGALHDIAALYLVDSNGNYYSPEDVLAAGVDYTVASSLPTAGAGYKGKIYLVADSSDVEGGSYIEYICVNTSGTNWAWEPIGTTKVNVSVASVSSNKDTVTVQYDKATGATTSQQPATTVNGNNFSFSGTTATVTVSGTAASHSHSIGEGTKGYFTVESNVPKTFSSTSVISSLKTATITPVGESQSVVTGYNSPSTTTGVTSVSANTSRYVTQTVYGAGTTSVATVGSATTVVNGLSGDTTFVKTSGSLSTTYLTKSNIYPAANITALRKEDVTVGTAVSLTTRLGTGTVISAASANTTNVFNGASVSNDGVLSFTTTTVNKDFSATSKTVSDTNIVPSVSVGNGVSVRGTSTSYLTGGTTSTASGNVLVAYGKASDTSGTVSATTISVTPAGSAVTVATRGTAYTVITSGTTTTGGVQLATGITAATATVLTGLGSPSTASVATAGTGMTVVTGANGTANAYTGISSSVTLVKGLTTTSNSNGTVITGLPASTGNKDASVSASGDFQPAGTIGGSQSIAAHSHTVYISNTATSATVNVTGHTHTVTLSGGSVNN